MRKNKPWLTILGYPCTNWCIYNKNVNFQGLRRAILDARRMSEKEIKELTAWTMREQYDGGRWFLFENPPTSDVFVEPEFTPIWTLPGVYSAVNHNCQWGAVRPTQNLPIKKPTRWVGNNKNLLTAIVRRCGGKNACPEHASIEGGATKGSQVYLPRWCSALLVALRAEIGRVDPYRWTDITHHETMRFPGDSKEGFIEARTFARRFSMI